MEEKANSKGLPKNICFGPIGSSQRILVNFGPFVAILIFLILFWSILVHTDPLT